MGAESKIEWTDASWNPTVGCSILSAGCKNCYAMRMAARCAAMGSAKYAGLTQVVNGHPVWTGEMRLDEDALRLPLHWTRPRRVFVNSMSDLFHEQVPDEWIDRIFGVMAAAPRHQFQVLTKRADRMRDYCTDRTLAARVAAWKCTGGSYPAQVIAKGSEPLPLANVWLGVSVEDQVTADARIPPLLETPAATRFVSAEPLIGPIRLKRDFMCRHCYPRLCLNNVYHKQMLLDWVICGGESGPGARPMHPAWARSLRDQCVAAGVAFFFKQWGEWAPAARYPSGAVEYRIVTPDGGGRADEPNSLPGDFLMARVGKHPAGRVLDGRTWDELPAGHEPMPDALFDALTEEGLERNRELLLRLQKGDTDGTDD